MKSDKIDYAKLVKSDKKITPSEIKVIKRFYADEIDYS